MFQMFRHKNVYKKKLQMIEFTVRILCIHFENDGYMSACMHERVLHHDKRSPVNLHKISSYDFSTTRI